MQQQHVMQEKQRSRTHIHRREEHGGQAQFRRGNAISQYRIPVVRDTEEQQRNANRSIGKHIAIPQYRIIAVSEAHRDVRSGERKRNIGIATECNIGTAPESAGSGVLGRLGRVAVESSSPNELRSDALFGLRKGGSGDNRRRAS